MESIGIIVDTIGKLLVAYAALRVHHRVRHEHAVDAKVFRAMRHEQIFGIIGIAAIVIGSTLEVLAAR